MIREKLKGFSVIPSRYEKDVPIWKTRGKYRKEMKRGYSKILYNQRNKDETIVSVIKRLFGEHISSRLIRMQNRELTFRCITYNIHRMLNLIIIKWILLSRLPIVFSGFSSGKIFLISFQRRSGIRVIVVIYCLLLAKYLTDNIIKQMSYILIYFWDRL